MPMKRKYNTDFVPSNVGAYVGRKMNNKNGNNRCSKRDVVWR